MTERSERPNAGTGRTTRQLFGALDMIRDGMNVIYVVWNHAELFSVAKMTHGLLIDSNEEFVEGFEWVNDVTLEFVNGCELKFLTHGQVGQRPIRGVKNLVVVADHHVFEMIYQWF